jgi:hypothetical protein
MRFVLFIPLLAAALGADPITVLQTTSGSAFGFTSASYSYEVPNSTGAVSARVDSSTNCQFSPTCTKTDFAFTSIELTLDLYTPGPMRDGVAAITMYADSDGGSGGGARETASVGPYGLYYLNNPNAPNCPLGISCELANFFQFELGVPFTIDLYVLSEGPLGGGGADAFASIQLFERPQPGDGATGAPVQIYLVPEPSAVALAATGLSALVLLAALRKSKFSGKRRVSS